MGEEKRKGGRADVDRQRETRALLRNDQVVVITLHMPGLIPRPLHIQTDGDTVDASVKVLIYMKFRTYKLSKGKQNSFTL